MSNSVTQLEPARSILLKVGAAVVPHVAEHSYMVAGIRKICELTGRKEGSVYRWMYPKERGGADGWVPPEDAVIILGWAVDVRADIDAEDFLPPSKSKAVGGVKSRVRGCQHVG